MTTYRITFEGPASLALSVVTALADAEGVELISSEPPTPTESGSVVLGVTVDGASIAVGGAVDRIRDGLPAGSTITVAER